MEPVTIGLRQNIRQFLLLILINAFVGGMVGLERAILPQIAEAEFHLAAKSAMLSFIMVFGFVKALSNYYAGTFAQKIGRKNLLVVGWLFALPVPFLLMWANSWNWIIVANVLLGINQGLAWSTTVLMKIDLVGEKDRGFAMGLNEFAGYLAVALVAFATGMIAGSFGLRPYPFHIGIFLALAGLVFSWLWVKDTKHHVAKETAQSSVPRLKQVFWDTTVRDRNLGSVTQAGLINNLNDGMTWGLLPVLLLQKHFDLQEVAMVTAVYPAVWGIGQLVTGKMSDLFCKKDLLFWGMLLQGLALAGMIFAGTFVQFIVLAALLGWGTAMVYPTFLATIAEHTHPLDRPKSLGVFRLWRDMGYVIGAILTGLLADAFGISVSVAVVGALTLASALVIRGRMRCVSKKPKIFDVFRWRFMRQKQHDETRYSAELTC